MNNLITELLNLDNKNPFLWILLSDEMILNDIKIVEINKKKYTPVTAKRQCKFPRPNTEEIIESGLKVMKKTGYKPLSDISISFEQTKKTMKICTDYIEETDDTNDCIDIIMTQMGVSYNEAIHALQESNWDVFDTLMILTISISINK